MSTKREKKQAACMVVPDSFAFETVGEDDRAEDKISHASSVLVTKILQILLPNKCLG